MRVAIAVVGVIFAVGFLCVPLVGPPSPNAWWVTALCVGVCLLISVACLKNLLGEIVRRMFGAAALIAYGAYLVSVVREGRFPWGPIGGLLVYGLPGGLYALYGGRSLSAFAQLLGAWKGEELQAEMNRARPIGFVFCGWKRFRSYEKAESAVFDRLTWELLSCRRAGTVAEARSFGAEMLRRSRNDFREFMPLASAESLIDRFLNNVTKRGESMQVWIAEHGDRAGIAVIGRSQAGFLTVDDSYDDDWDEDEEEADEQATA